MLLRLSGKIAIVTGSSQGMGKGIALGFARAGADLVLGIALAFTRHQGSSLNSH